MDNETLDSKERPTTTDAFNRLFQGLRTAVNEFQNEATPENFGKLVTLVGAYGATSSKLWTEVSRFARKHPVQAAIGAGVVFYAYKTLFNKRTPEQETEWRAQNFH